MGRDYMIGDVATISSGTLARLFGVTGYEDIEHHLAIWIAWIAKQKDCEWDSWVDCWHDYKSQPDDYTRGLLYGGSKGAIRLEHWEIVELWPAVLNLLEFERGMMAGLSGDEVAYTVTD